MDNNHSTENIFTKLDIRLVEKWLREYGDTRVKINAAGTEVVEEVRYIRQGEAIIQDVKQYLENFNDSHAILFNQVKRYQLLVEELKDFVDEHDFLYLSERNFMSWLIALICPWLIKCITKLVYDMHHLRKSIVKLEKD